MLRASQRSSKTAQKSPNLRALSKRNSSNRKIFPGNSKISRGRVPISLVLRHRQRNPPDVRQRTSKISPTRNRFPPRGYAPKRQKHRRKNFPQRRGGDPPPDRDSDPRLGGESSRLLRDHQRHRCKYPILTSRSTTRRKERTIISRSWTSSKCSAERGDLSLTSPARRT